MDKYKFDLPALLANETDMGIKEEIAEGAELKQAKAAEKPNSRTSPKKKASSASHKTRAVSSQKPKRKS